MKPYYQDDSCTIYNDDCLEVVKNISKESIDLVVTDPPYNLSYSGRNRLNRFDVFDNDNLSDTNYSNFIENIMCELYRVLKNNTAIYIYIDFRNYALLFNIIKKYFDIKNCIVWVKNNFGMGQYYRFKHEFCIFAIKGEYKFARNDVPDVWNFKKDAALKYKHPTQKPKSVMLKPIEYSSNEGDLILDPFLGSGTTARACKDLGRKCIGIEISKEYCDIAVQRLGQEVLF